MKVAEDIEVNNREVHFLTPELKVLPCLSLKACLPVGFAFAHEGFGPSQCCELDGQLLGPFCEHCM